MSSRVAALAVSLSFIVSGSALAAGLTVSPGGITTDHAGTLTMSVTGVAAGASVRIESFLDLDADDVVDAADPLVQSIRATDGQVTAIAGIRLGMVPGDEDGTADGDIEIVLRFRELVEAMRIGGRYLHRVTGVTPPFAPVTVAHVVGLPSHAQRVEGTVRAGAAIPHAIAFILSAESGEPLAAEVADASGRFSLPVPPGACIVGAFADGFTASTWAQVEVTSGAVVTQDVELTPADRSITGFLRDEGSGVGIPGVQLVLWDGAGGDEEGVPQVLAFTRADGSFAIPVTSSASWRLQGSESAAVLGGWVAPADAWPADTTGGGIANLVLPWRSATSVIHGRAHENGVGVEGLHVRAGGGTHESRGLTDATGHFSVPVTAGTWDVVPDSDELEARGYLGSSERVTVADGEARLIDLPLTSANARIRGQVRETDGTPVGDAAVRACREPAVGSQPCSFARSAPDGSYEIAVSAGSWSVYAEVADRGLVGPLVVVTVEDGQVLLGVDLPCRRVQWHVVGQVRDRLGTPVAGLLMSGRLVTAPGEPAYPVENTTGPGGSYFLAVFDGSWDIGPACGDLTRFGYNCPEARSIDIDGSGAVADWVLDAGECVADCDGSETVTIAEISVARSIALESAPLADCPWADWNGDFRVRARELVQALRGLRMGCTMGQRLHLLGVARQGSGSGVVTSAPAGIACGSDCSESVQWGTTVVLTAAADSESVFTGWSGGGCSGTGTCEVAVTADTWVTATFEVVDRLAWKRGTGRPIYYSSPAIGAGGTVYVGNGAPFGVATEPPGLHAFAPDGTLSWDRQLPGGAYVFTPVVGPDGTIYVHDAAGALHAVAPDGDVLWTTTFPVSYVEVGQVAPAIAADGTIYAVAGMLRAVRPDGTMAWSQLLVPPPGALYSIAYARSSPAVAPDGTIYYGANGTFAECDDGCVIGNALFMAVRPDGTTKWSRVLVGGTAIFSSPAIGADGVVYVGSEISGEGRVHAFDADGNELWHVSAPGTVRSSPAIGADGTIYVGAKAGTEALAELIAIAPDGTVRWRYSGFEPGQDVYCSPAVGADGLIYFGSESGRLVALRPDGSVAWSYRTNNGINWTSPAITPDGTLYIGNNDGFLFAIETGSPGLAASPWPKFRHDNENTGRR